MTRRSDKYEYEQSEQYEYKTVNVLIDILKELEEIKTLLRFK